MNFDIFKCLDYNFIPGVDGKNFIKQFSSIKIVR